MVPGRWNHIPAILWFGEGLSREPQATNQISSQLYKLRCHTLLITQLGTCTCVCDCACVCAPVCGGSVRPSICVSVGGYLRWMLGRTGCFGCYEVWKGNRRAAGARPEDRLHLHAAHDSPVFALRNREVPCQSRGQDSRTLL